MSCIHVVERMLAKAHTLRSIVVRDSVSCCLLENLQEAMPRFLPTTPMHSSAWDDMHRVLITTKCHAILRLPALYSNYSTTSSVNANVQNCQRDSRVLRIINTIKVLVTVRWTVLMHRQQRKSVPILDWYQGIVVVFHRIIAV